MGYVGPSSVIRALDDGRSPTLVSMSRRPRITSLSLPIDWTSLGWPEWPSLGGITVANADPAWSWEPTAPAFAVGIDPVEAGTPVEGFGIDHVVLLVPALDSAIGTLDRIGLQPRLRMRISGDRPAAFFRVGPVLEVIEAPVRQASLYGIALTSEEPLETVALRWRSLGLSIGDIKPAIQPGRRIMTVHDLDAGLAVMSKDGAASVT